MYINNYGKTSGTIKKQAWFTSINQSGVLTLQLPKEYMPSCQNLVFIEVKKKANPRLIKNWPDHTGLNSFKSQNCQLAYKKRILRIRNQIDKCVGWEGADKMKMASFVAKFILFFLAFTLFCAKIQGTDNHGRRVKKGTVSSHLMRLYNILTNQSNQTTMPFNATAVRAMHFSSIQSKSLRGLLWFMYSHMIEV